MRIVVVGANGRTGLRVVAAGLRRGAEIVAVVRDPSRLGDLRGRVSVIVGDVREPGLLQRDLRADDAVISTLGGVLNDASADAAAVGVENIVAATQASGASRLLGVAGAGVLLADSGVPRHTLPDYPPRFRVAGAQHQATLAAFERSGLAWLLVCTPRLVDAAATGRIQVLRDHLPPGRGEVTTGDVAELLVREALAPTEFRVRLGVNQLE